jgi:ABC-type branched-subunit amino acid transport system substrate-binding protein
MAWDVTPSRLASACARVIEAGDTDADDIKLALPEIAAAYAGVTGNCSLDSNGDRNTAVYGIYRFTSQGTGCMRKRLTR